MDSGVQARLFGGIGAAAIVVAIGAGLILGLDVDMRRTVEQPLALIRIDTPPPPPPERRPPPQRPRPAPARNAPSPPNLRGRATPIAAATPILRIVPTPPIIAAAQPDAGSQTDTGASDRAGEGEGAGGQGEGSGGGYGDGDGGRAPRQTGGRLRIADLPEPLRQAITRQTVGVRYRVAVDGHVENCRTIAPSGLPDLDAATCQLIEQRFRYRPARDAAGTAISSIIEETHTWLVERETGPDR